MDAFVITQRGAEQTAAADIKDIVGRDGEQQETVVLFDSDDDDLIQLAYRTQSVNRVLRLLGIAEVNNNLEESISAVKRSLPMKLSLQGTFRVTCARVGEHDYSCQDFASMLGDIFVEKTGAKVSLQDPTTVVYAHIWNDRCYVGIDITGLDLGKRDYKVFNHPSALTGITAYAALRLSGFKSGKTLLDPFCGVGTIPIEAALYATRTSPHLFKRDKFPRLEYTDRKRELKGAILGYDYLLRFIIASKKNASIAGIEKDILVSKVEVEWLDTKVDKETVDVIVTHPPSPSKMVDPKEINKLYKEFLYQCDYVMKKDGRMTIVLQNDSLFREALAGDVKWVLKSTASIWQGSQEFKVISAERSVK